MSFLALHRGSDTGLCTTRWLLCGDEVTACDSAIEMLTRLQDLEQRRSAELSAAVADARAAGYLAGRQEALGLLAPRWLLAWEQVATATALQTDHVRKAVVVLACGIVRQIAEDLEPSEVVASLARRALHQHLPAPSCTVRVHPDVAQAVAAILNKSAPGGPPSLPVVQADATLGLLDCVIKTALGECVASLESQLGRLSASGIRAGDPP
jgi:flagellar biosynthesis/type III secretory pathway protein FliH